MNKTIMVTGLRNGVGRTTLACLIGTLLGKQGFKTLIIDNNHKFSDTCNYLMVHSEYSIDDLKPFLRSGVLKKNTIKSMVTKVGKNLDLINGSNLNFVDNILSKEDFIMIKNLLNDVYDFIIIDQGIGLEDENTQSLLETIDLGIFVSEPNKYEYNHYENIVVSSNMEKNELTKILMENFILVYNKVTDSTINEHKSLSKIFPKERIFDFKYDSNILNFCNGYECKVDKNNQKVVKNILKLILNNKTGSYVPKNKSISTRFKSMFSLFSK